MEKKYFITKEQLETIGHYKRMFEVEADIIKELCSSERDDVVYGFELGKSYAHMSDCFVNMMELEKQIRNQNFEMEVVK